MKRREKTEKLKAMKSKTMNPKVFDCTYHVSSKMKMKVIKTEKIKIGVKHRWVWLTAGTCMNLRRSTS
jgi:hypothetical protein